MICSETSKPLQEKWPYGNTYIVITCSLLSFCLLIEFLLLFETSTCCPVKRLSVFSLHSPGDCSFFFTDCTFLHKICCFRKPAFEPEDAQGNWRSPERTSSSPPRSRPSRWSLRLGRRVHKFHMVFNAVTWIINLFML